MIRLHRVEEIFYFNGKIGKFITEIKYESQRFNIAILFWLSLIDKINC